MIDPLNMTVTEWADATILSLPDTWSFPRLDDETLWQDWGVSLVRAYATRNLPNPYGFEDWREWAMRIYPLLEPVTS